ncbi:thioredoxin family protein [Agromyces subbeticus]|uniref:thioredoxin family protein n=1 Tax=Agromyces subbeticus TaxID=293890 RepID=UPI0003B3B2B0|nr:thioredoxin family protein [Agromyces subbeticus]
MRTALTLVALTAMLALTGCASNGALITDEPASTPMASAPSPTSPAATEATQTGPDVAPGAYLDYADGVIAATEGAKVLFFHASWCPKCRALDEELRAQGALDGLTVFKVDYDSRTDLRQQYEVTLQTTVVFVDDAGEKISSTVLYEDPSIAALVAAMP